MSIEVLDPIVASRIAAGEVVERPASVLRELLDNSIDAQSTKISVYLEEGGIRSLTVTDNGKGISEQDLPKACLSHATSKIKKLDDLFNLRTLGFRGEALSSIASCSRLTLASNSKKIVVDNGIQSDILPGATTEGTTITMEDLFENIPARKLFLKRPQSEASECRKTLLEKALGAPEVEFLFFNEGALSVHLVKSDRKGRALDIMKLDRSFICPQAIEMHCKDENVEIYAVASDPGCHKRDRSQIRILVNNRIVDFFPFTQAITNAYSVALPGGAFPFFYLFIDDNPALVDFNIHPSKRECKMRNQSQVYGLLVNLIRESLIKATTKPEQPDTPEPVLFSGKTPDSASDFVSGSVSEVKRPSGKASPGPQNASRFDPSWFDNAKRIMSKAKEELAEAPKPVQSPACTASLQSPTSGEPQYTYIGQVFSTFLVVEKEDRVLFIDQHAAHERILYEELLSQKDVQNLIVPYRFEVERSVDEYLDKYSFIYADFGIQLLKVEPLLWEISTIPAACRKNEAQIASYIQTQTGDVDTVKKGLFAVIACHSAIKAGDTLDSYSARELLKKIFQLPSLLCPHGRSFVHEIAKEELYREVGRLI